MRKPAQSAERAWESSPQSQLLRRLRMAFITQPVNAFGTCRLPLRSCYERPVHCLLRRRAGRWRPGTSGGRPASMTPFSENPFAALTIVAAPAILTNASSVLCLGTANRLARVVDRTRVVSAELAHVAPNAASSL